jgi:mRNA interferase RelE/StbE
VSEAPRLELTRPALRDLKRLDPPVRRRILEALDGLTEMPPRGDVRRLAGQADAWRLRVGDRRVRFTRDRDSSVIYVLRVLPRGRAYRG